MLGYILGVIATNPAVVLAAAKSTEKEQVSAFGTWGMYILIAVMIGVFYFLMIRPQRKKVQQQEEMLRKLEIGDEVVTIGGVHGTVKALTDDTMVLEVDDGVGVTFNRSAVSRNLTANEVEEEEAEEEEVEEEEAEEEVAPEEESDESAGEEDKEE